MEVSHNVVGVMDEDVHRCGGHENARQTTDHEHRDKGKRKQHRSGKFNFSSPNSSQPVKYFNCGWQRNHHGGDHEGHTQHGIHSGNKHMMSPNDKSEPSDTGDGIDHRLITKNRFPGKAGQYVRHHTHRG